MRRLEDSHFSNFEVDNSNAQISDCVSLRWLFIRVCSFGMITSSLISNRSPQTNRPMQTLFQGCDRGFLLWLSEFVFFETESTKLPWWTHKGKYWRDVYERSWRPAMKLVYWCPQEKNSRILSIDRRLEIMQIDLGGLNGSIHNPYLIDNAQ